MNNKRNPSQTRAESLVGPELHGGLLTAALCCIAGCGWRSAACLAALRSHNSSALQCSQQTACYPAPASSGMQLSERPILSLLHTNDNTLGYSTHKETFNHYGNSIFLRSYYIHRETAFLKKIRFFFMFLFTFFGYERF